MSVADSIRAALTAALRPTELTIEDQSALHAGHVGAGPQGETHFRVRIVSPEFLGMSRVARHRHVYGLLADQIQTRIHALSLETLTPDEASR